MRSKVFGHYNQVMSTVIDCWVKAADVGVGVSKARRWAHSMLEKKNHVSHEAHDAATTA